MHEKTSSASVNRSIEFLEKAPKISKLFIKYVMGFMGLSKQDSKMFDNFFANSGHSASNFKSFSRSLEQFWKQNTVAKFLPSVRKTRLKISRNFDYLFFKRGYYSMLRYCIQWRVGKWNWLSISFFLNKIERLQTGP